jgi:cytochrome c oxidase subunit 2
MYYIQLTCLILELQMNCVPGMTQFCFEPIYTDEYRELCLVKGANINAIRTKKSADLVAKGETVLDPYI